MDLVAASEARFHRLQIIGPVLMAAAALFHRLRIIGPVLAEGVVPLAVEVQVGAGEVIFRHIPHLKQAAVAEAQAGAGEVIFRHRHPRWNPALVREA
jgi:hypothetical protein